jgi:hypothetical protein
MPGALQVYGTERMRTLGGYLSAIGGPSARGLRSSTRKAIVVSVLPIQNEIRAGYRALPGRAGGTGLGEALAKGTKRRILMSARSAVVEIYVDPNTKHGDGTLRNLPAYVEGTARKPWKHPVYPDPSKDRSEWHWTKVPQPPHPTFYPIARKGQAEALAGTVAAVRATLAQLPKEIP